LGLLEGVIRTRVGYMGGTTADPTYENLGDHTETVQLDYDPTVISYEELLTVFFGGHDCAVGGIKRQYMSVVFFHDAEQERLARETRAALEARLGTAVQTQILPAITFYLAEDYHQKHGLQGYESFMREFRAMYPEFADIVDSTSAARVNGYLYGYGTKGQLRRELGSLGLSEEAQNRLLFPFE
jgi:peptide-methionine (S)-S-oxide reductase